LGVAAQADGRFLIADAASIRRVEVDGTISTIAGTAIFDGFSGDGGPATRAELNSDGVADLADGRILIADRGNGRIRRVELDGTISTIAGNGESRFSGDGGPATSAALAGPFGVAAVADGRVLIVDTGNHRIRRIELDGTITTIAGNGNAGFAGDGGPATSAVLNLPRGATALADGRVLVADQDNHRIRRIELDGTITTVAGTGTAGFSGDGGPATSAALSAPGGVAAQADGRVLVADRNNRRIRRIELDGTIITIAGRGN
jgi:sugar lactone lactonase YvrE